MLPFHLRLPTLHFFIKYSIFSTLQHKVLLIMRFRLSFIHLCIYSFCILCFSSACKTSNKASDNKKMTAFFYVGHRGTRGLMPENTIPAMEKGITVGANTVEMD